MARMLAIAAAVVASASGPTVVARVPTGKAPCGVVAAAHLVWVANDGGSLAAISPRTSRVVVRMRLAPGACTVAAGAGALWVANYKQSTVVRVDLGSRRMQRIAVDDTPVGVAVAFGRVWVAAWESGKLDVLDTVARRVVRRIDVGPRPTDVTSAGGAVWVGFGRDATSIARVDPVSLAVERVPVGERSPSEFMKGTRDLWLTADGGDLVRIDPTSRKALSTLHVGRTLARGAVAPDGTLWVPDKEQSVVYRIDPVQGRVVDSFAAGPGAYVVERAFGAMWVASYAGSDVWRFRP